MPLGTNAGGDEPKGRRAPGKSLSEKGLLATGLYVVATPIGNAADISLRALKILKNCEAIVAEDTRVTAKLLALHGISRPLVTYNDHNADRERPKLLTRLADGAALALVSDAGTPLISDPGFKLVREAREANIAVYAVPGASALLAALSIAGLPTDRFFFLGFLPARAGERQKVLQELRAVRASLVFFESPQRLRETLASMMEIFGARDAAVTRELTKLHEEVRKGTLAELAKYYATAENLKGEITLVVGPPAKPLPSGEARVDELLLLALPHMPVKTAAELVAAATGRTRREIYSRALQLKEKDG